ncbi:MAG TPA: hypothetical protein VK960_08000 [Acidimicrobiia bacterium]|nr:hypothetical protein [Acidimicrobiia bacterium]
MDDSFIIGLVLLAVVPLVVVDAVGGMRAGFDNAFWARPLAEKLPLIAQRRRVWDRLSLIWVPINLLLMAGLTAFAFQLATTEEGVWGALGVGVFIPVATAFIAVVLLMAATIGRAAEDGSVPAWSEPAWQATGWIERTFVIGGNLAHVSIGVGIVASGHPAEWAGWVAIVSGALLAIWASLRDYFFQHMVLIAPLALGVALILE